MAQHEPRPHGAAHVHAHAHDDHVHGHGHDDGHGHAHVPYDQVQVEREITADRQWMFDKFIQWTGWNLVVIFIILALLALTQT